MSTLKKYGCARVTQVPFLVTLAGQGVAGLSCLRSVDPANDERLSRALDERHPGRGLGGT